MRELQAQDLFRFVKILRKLELRKELQKLTAPDLQKDPAQAFFQVLWAVLENVDKAEQEIYEFFGDIAGMSADEFKTMGLVQLGDFINELKNQEGIGHFFRSAFNTATRN